ncbi:hypothetical protein GCM10007981_08110 [Thermocladium modestius]|uniref:Uncharacterized protein n=1 Tax=Thermocladium modestius TaxID=62609 RepID=A0A830GTD7_9CREN|nr:hypothetical protein [Thermocladium modestius]GGP20358.1 hypothetical protein GCM10007981_08110 [Thermocladium modestius]
MAADKYMNLALIVSVVAAALIEVALAFIYFVGIYGIFNWPYISILIVLLLLGFPAYYGYSKSTKHAMSFIRYATPLALILAIIGLILGHMHEFSGIISLFLAYIIEEATGILLRMDFREFSKTWTDVFAVGMSIFVVSILLVLISTKLVVIPMIGDAIKGLGIYMIYSAANANN